MVDIDAIPNFPELPGQRTRVPANPIEVILVSARLDSQGQATPLTSAEVDAYMAGEITAGRGLVKTVERWSPWSNLDLEIGYADAVGYNYGRFTVGGKRFYAYLDAVYNTLTTTTFAVTPDDWPTYNPTIGYSSIVRSHIAVAASLGDTYGDQFLLEPEPIDAPPTVGVVQGGAFDGALSSWTAIVTSANDLRGSGATPFFEQHTLSSDILNAHLAASHATRGATVGEQITIQQVDYPWTSSQVVYIPKVTPAPGSSIDGVPAGGGVFIFSLGGWLAYQSVMQNAPWIMSGISEVRYEPSWAVPNNGSPAGSPAPTNNPISTAWGLAAARATYVANLTTTQPIATAIANWRNSALTAVGGAGYRKLLTSQFCEIVVGGAGETTLRPEAIRSNDISFRAIPGGVIGGSDVALPQNYSSMGDVTPIAMDISGVGRGAVAGYGMAMSDVSTLDTALLNLAYGNDRTRDVLFEQQALAVALAITGARMSMGVQGIQAVLSTAGGATGGAAGALTAAGTAIGGLATSSITANNNLDLLDMAQDGSLNIATYQMGVSGISAWRSLQTAIQSAISRSGSGGSMAVGGWRPSVGSGLTTVVKLPPPDRVRAAVSMWERYGYMIGRAFIPPRLDAMTAYTYWQIDEPTIIGNMPDEARLRIAERFKRGTTVWTDVNAIGTHPTNTPRAGITY